MWCEFTVSILMLAALILQAVQMAADRIHHEADPATSGSGASAFPADVHTAAGTVVSRGLMRSSSSSSNLAPAGVGGSSGSGAASVRLTDSSHEAQPPERHEWMYRQALAVTSMIDALHLLCRRSMVSVPLIRGKPSQL